MSNLILYDYPVNCQSSKQIFFKFITTDSCTNPAGARALGFFACVTCRTLLFAKLQNSCVIIKVLHIAPFRQNAIREKNEKFKFKFICISQIKKKYEFLDDFEFSIKCAIQVNPGRFCSLPVVQCVNYINS